MEKIQQGFEDLKQKVFPFTEKLVGKSGSSNSKRDKKSKETQPVVAPKNNAQTQVSSSVGKYSGNMKPLHQLWYLEEDLTFVPMACYRSKQTPETSHVLSDKDEDGNCVWCVPLSKKYAVDAVPPVNAQDCTPVAGGLGYQLNIDQQKKRPLRRLISTGITMGIGAGVLKAVQVVNEKGGIRGFITAGVGGEEKQQ